jgi:N-acyl-phosphatidylethanolamine-hydrolysing phospholipase D
MTGTGMNRLSVAALFLLPALLTSCNAVRSTGAAGYRNVVGVFSAPREVTGKIARPVRQNARLAVLWIGHATVLLQLDERFILTDPNLTPTAGMFSKRLVEPGIDPANLPLLDAVLISHMHVDHLSYGSLDLIEKRVKQLLVPEGGLVYIPNYDFETDELKAWEAWESDGLRVTAVPVLHIGWRYGLDDAWMKRSFTGYVIEYKGMTVYFGGDTAYDSTLFKETGKRFPRIDLAMLPLAPINPREYSKARHTDPGEALKIYRDLGARWMMPIHFDTYPESLDSLGEATATLRAGMAEQKLTGNEVVVLEIGQQRVLIPKRDGDSTGE